MCHCAVELSQMFFEEIRHSVPLDMEVLAKIKNRRCIAVQIWSAIARSVENAKTADR